jgi:hypothetical protein
MAKGQSFEQPRHSHRRRQNTEAQLRAKKKMHLNLFDFSYSNEKVLKKSFENNNNMT